MHVLLDGVRACERVSIGVGGDGVGSARTLTERSFASDRFRVTMTRRDDTRWTINQAICCASIQSFVDCVGEQFARFLLALRILANDSVSAAGCFCVHSEIQSSPT